MTEPVGLQPRQVDKLREMWENGCPTYEDGQYYTNCWFCNERERLVRGVARNIDHHSSCPWLTLEEIFANE